MDLKVSKVVATVEQWEHAIDPADPFNCLVHGQKCLDGPRLVHLSTCREAGGCHCRPGTVHFTRYPRTES
jgi:hypothetical protein